MIKEIEELLYSKTLGKQSDILFAHWNYDKKIIPTALNAVANLFPHYSLHDESHSETIINNIVRVIGFENIKKLSAIDLWLILEASYSHDLGMVVSSDEMVKTLNTSEFLDFFRSLKDDPKNGLFEFAVQFEIEDKKIKYKHNELNLGFHDGIKFILAEFFRRTHSERSKDIILNVNHDLAIPTPRGVIPNRIFKILADICSSHTKDFADVMNLPFCEVGIDVEDAHPRFIACLLRIGDLLDLDNNRFSEVMLRTLSKIPIDTLNHKAKHLAIESFRVDNEKIEVFAKCDSYDIANITQHWFNYLDSEISNQMIRWNDIVPFKDFGYLPTIGELKVELIDYDYLDGKKKPKFSVDTDKALSLLQGAGLYEHAYQSFRELLQNAVDSTLIRIWLEHKDSYDFKSPQDEVFQNLLKQYPIEIYIEENEVLEKEKLSKISIKDNGIGISTEDLKYLMNTGSSSKNRKKINITDEMPEWLRPSGIFGIGFQSIFMLTDEVVIETKSFFTEQLQRIELNSPNSKKDGAVLIQKKKSNHSIKPGVKLNIIYKTDAIPFRWTIKGKQKNAMRIAHNFDPLSHDSLDINLGMIIDEILEFEYASIIPINLYINNIKHEFVKKENYFFKYFEPTNSLEMNISTNLSNNRTRTFYKNQYVENSIRNLSFLYLDVNIHKEKANQILTLNRNKIKSEAEGKLFDQILESTFKTVINNFNNLFLNDQQKQIGSMFLNFYKNEYTFLHLFDISKFEHWKDFEIDLNTDNKIKLSVLLTQIKTLTITFDTVIQSFPRMDIFDFNENSLTIELNSNSNNSNIAQFLFSQLENKIKRVVDFEYKINSSELKSILFDFETTSEDFFPLEKYVELLKKSISWNRSSRKIIPCLNKFFKLRLKDDATLPYLYHFDLSSRIDFKYPKMVSPFVVTEEDYVDREDKYVTAIVLNEKLYDWVFENRYDSSTDKEDIIKGYNDFINEFTIASMNSIPTQ